MRNLKVKKKRILGIVPALGQVETPYFTWAESNANEGEQRAFSHLQSIRLKWSTASELGLKSKIRYLCWSALIVDDTNIVIPVWRDGVDQSPEEVDSFLRWSIIYLFFYFSSFHTTIQYKKYSLSPPTNSKG